MYSFGGVKLDKGDEVIFMDAFKNRTLYRFIENGGSSLEGESSMHFNILKFDTEAIDWFSSNTIQTIYIKDNSRNEMRKFTIAEENKAKFKLLAKCFNLNLSKQY